MHLSVVICFSSRLHDSKRSVSHTKNKKTNLYTDAGIRYEFAARTNPPPSWRHHANSSLGTGNVGRVSGAREGGIGGLVVARKEKKKKTRESGLLNMSIVHCSCIIVVPARDERGRQNRQTGHEMSDSCLQSLVGGMGID